MKPYVLRIGNLVLSPYMAELDKKNWNAGHTFFSNEGATSYRRIGPVGSWIYEILFENSLI